MMYQLLTGVIQTAFPSPQPFEICPPAFCAVRIKVFKSLVDEYNFLIRKIIFGGQLALPGEAGADHTGYRIVIAVNDKAEAGAIIRLQLPAGKIKRGTAAGFINAGCFGFNGIYNGGVRSAYGLPRRHERKQQCKYGYTNFQLYRF